MSTRKQVEDWKQFYPVKLEEGRDNDHNKLPNLVEVIVGKLMLLFMIYLRVSKIAFPLLNFPIENYKR